MTSELVIFQSPTLYKTLNIAMPKATISLFILYGSGNQSLTVNKEHTSEVCEIKILRTISSNNKSETEHT
jgi:hypothetical protein